MELGWWWGIIFGAIAGSMANAVSYRIPRRISWVKGKSFCPKCKHLLAARDLIPIFSFLWLRGKCRYCGKKIPIRYLITELVMAFGWGLIFGLLPSSTWIELGQQAALAGGLWAGITIGIMDMETHLVSDLLVGIWAAAIAGELVLRGQMWQMENLAGMIAAGAVIGGIYYLSREKAMGLGDVGLAMAGGWWCGWPGAAYGLWMAFVAGGIAAAILLIMKKTKLKSEIAFAPFLVGGFWAARFGGEFLAKIWP